MKILFLSQVVPYPLDAGPKVRAYYVLRHLCQKHAVTLATFVRPSDTPEALAHLRSIVSNLVTCPINRSPLGEAAALGRSLLTGEPLLITRDRVPAMLATLRHLTAEASFDAIHADQLWMAPYALAAAAPRRGQTRPWLVLDQHNAVHLIPGRLAANARNSVMRLGWRREARRMAYYETRTCQAFDRVVTVTRADQAALAGLYHTGRQPEFTVIPICIDTEAIQSQPRLGLAPDLLFLGGMHWPPNADGVRSFADDILPAVRAALPQARFLAVGEQPPVSLLQPEAKGLVEAPGYVADPEPYWNRSQVFVVPLRAGGGMRVKILEAWARGLPVVATTIGAEGIDYRAGENLLIADTPEAFAAAVLAILTDAALAKRLAGAGRSAVERGYDWRQTYLAWDQIYAQQ